VLVLQHAARPHPGRDRVAATDADALAFEVLRLGDASLGVHQRGAVVESPHQKYRDRRHRLAMRTRADVGRDRHLGDVELVAAHHAAERGNDRIDLQELGLERLGLDGAVLEGLVVALRAGDESQLGSGHGGVSLR